MSVNFTPITDRLKTAFGLLVTIYQQYPARVTSIIVAVIIFLAAKLGIVVDQQTLGASLAYVLPILLGGQIIHTQVSPKA